ncbi:MAG: hypothetical protein MUF15_17510 [Acidobacteria bacterium]|jgi:hypothetical protein|nr:hypothetical protein [Acidobacteriota bacterium]
MLKKKEGKKLELTIKEKSKVYGGDCGQACYDSCPDDDRTRFCNYRGWYLDSAAGKFDPLPKK